MDELISIIIPVHGEGASAEVCVNSFLLGSVQNIEVLIIAETGDPTADLLLHTYENEPRVTVLVMMASGVSAKRNLGLDHAKGSLIVFADADDYADPDELRTLSSLLG
ncbi:MAG: glycosyltransferase, partial [Solobacterium sp.]|nr:glycosyltransferase [Solobacterium sp.]